MTQPNYFHAGENCFVIEQYNDCAPFASFLPGIAGMRGRPAWVFYVNRGQAIASFGVRNKDGAFLEFFPADKAYQLTPSRGFRTFLKVGDGKHSLNYEPFQRGAGPEVTQRLYVTPHEVGVEEINPKLGLRLRTDVFTLAEAPVAGLLRRVEVVNTADKAIHIEIVDGLPQVLPYAMNQWILKFMSRTSEAFMRVEGVAENLPFYRLKVWPTDSPQVEPVIAGNFFIGFLDGQHSRAIVDPERIFGLAGDFSQPERFFAEQALDFADQVSGNQTPAAFQHLTLSLQPGESRVFYGVYGHAGSREILDQFLIEAAQPDYFEAKREANRRLVENISQRAFTATAKPLFDAHARQCYLDNGLRGGFSMPVPGGAHLYLFGRKHGDLERDYNDFLLQDTPYSEGNGDFRDVLQNRRMDLFFDPALDAKNIRYFFNLIQPDGYNPCSLRNSRFALDEPRNFAQYYPYFPALESLLHKEFKYAELVQALESATDAEAILTAILTQTREVEDAEFDRGYWSDHWTYLVDLLISYSAIFPDRLADLFQDKTYSFFDPTHIVAPRAQKYVVTANGVRQYNAVQYRPEKKSLIDARRQRRYQVRSQAGHGEIVHTSLLGKILTLVANKLATLDPAGVGIEMEADRPGWCDALNGLPGILGSSVNETIELERLVVFTRRALSQFNVPCALPVELAHFVIALHNLLTRSDLTPELFWQESGALKEAYREQVFMGFAGAEQKLALGEIQNFLSLAANYLDAAIDKARTPMGIATYFAYDAEQYRALETGGIAVMRFRQKQLPLFLEGFVHALRIADPAQAHTLYQAVQNSELFDTKLGMYRVNEPLGDNALDLGRIGVFNYGWLENGSIFLHMHYKFVLEMVRAGLVAEFYANIETLLLPFHEPAEYKRNPIENSSFLVSSGFTVDARQHGRGCVARLSGATVEFLHLWMHLFLGPTPFVFEADSLAFKPAPLLAAAFFTTHEQSVTPFAELKILPADSATCTLFGSTLLVYLNPQHRDTFGPNAVKPIEYRLYGRDGGKQTFDGDCIEGQTAEALRLGQFRRVDVLLG
ncbi:MULTISPECIES: hypothetical protein [Methylomonas]|uniref:Cellobiose phosphorylase n=2 Tax=Methylomonas TaxID=416 RepID=A0A140E694_9GAMM|nr:MULTISPECIES: hypothetical protein [Methylomonas]AMK78918.1 hypothetical protein JT25_020930 [Methylomonas denitrificans]OAI01437.1 hypothetical protein A1342_09635 [Methylomonas methanica]TCV76848.1 hypothetical protein EDE11_1325 [Methylomonas methanica]